MYTIDEILEHRKLWAADLRSGEYQQTFGQLRRDVEGHPSPVGHCCLGVACETAIVAGVITDYDPCDAIPSDAVSEWLGLEPGTLANTTVTDEFGSEGVETLGSMNDGGFASFIDVADMLDAGDVLIFDPLSQRYVDSQGRPL